LKVESGQLKVSVQLSVSVESFSSVASVKFSPIANRRFGPANGAT
jgi:hypothetical protein